MTLVQYPMPHSMSTFHKDGMEENRLEQVYQVLYTGMQWTCVAERMNTFITCSVRCSWTAKFSLDM